VTPGFVTGFWTLWDSSNGRSLIVYESEEDANAAVVRLTADLPQDMTLLSTEVRAIVASA
jgi:hypothetical protein